MTDLNDLVSTPRSGTALTGNIIPAGILSNTPPVTLTERAAADYLSLSVRTLQKRRFERQNPPYLKIGRSVRYRVEDLDKFLEAHRVDPAKAA